MKDIKSIHDLIKKSQFVEKIQIIFATKDADESYDEYENKYEYTNLSPITIRGLVRMISPEALVWKQYGLKEMGAIEIITESKYLSWFKNCNQVIYDKQKYSVFKDGSSGRAIIEKRPNNLIRVVLMRQ